MDDVECAVRKLKVSKSDSIDSLTSDNFIFACRDLFVHISMLLTMTLQHADAPEAMAHSVLVPIVKNPKKSLNDGSNYRSIAISSIIGKIFDNVVLKKHGCVLNSCDLQFGFCTGHSTTMCTFVLDEITNYYAQLNAPVYITLLDASRAFDRVNFVKLFELLLSKNFCALTAKFLISLYISQTLCVRWSNTVSSTFQCSNGVKQGGVLSPVLFCTYMDALLSRLKTLGLGCHIGRHYVGAVCYADDLTLISPTRSAAQAMLDACDRFAREYDVIFNGTKSVSIVVNSRHCVNASDLTLHGQCIPRMNSSVHLGHHIGVDAHRLNIQHAIADMNRRVNGLLCDFKYCSFDSIRLLFQSYCTSFYGCSLWKLGDVQRLSVCWRKCLRRLFRLPPRTHSSFIPLLMQKPDLNTQLLMRCSNFVYKCLQSTNYVVRICSELCLSSTSSVNSNLCLIRYLVNCSNSDFTLPRAVSRKLFHNWLDSCTEIDVCHASLLTELLRIRDGVLTSPLSPGEIRSLIDTVSII